MINLNNFQHGLPLDDEQRSEPLNKIVIPNGVIITREASYATLDTLHCLYNNGKISLTAEQLALLKEWLAVQYKSGGPGHRHR